MQTNGTALRHSAIEAGAYYWLKAEGREENQESALARFKYSALIARLRALGIATPTASELYAHAAKRWASGKLHPAPKSA